MRALIDALASGDAQVACRLLSDEGVLTLRDYAFDEAVTRRRKPVGRAVVSKTRTCAGAVELLADSVRVRAPSLRGGLAAGRTTVHDGTIAVVVDAQGSEWGLDAVNGRWAIEGLNPLADAVDAPPT